MNLSNLLEEGLAIRLAGIGGQGAVLLGDVLAHAGALDGLSSACSTLYGSQARGGAAKSEVILSRHQIDFPHAEHPHILVALSQEAFDAFAQDMADPAIVLADSYFVKKADREELDVRLFSATQTVLDELGASQPANFFLLGVLVGLTGCVGRESLDDAMKAHVRARHLDVNRRAVDLGMKAATDWNNGKGNH